MEVIDLCSDDDGTEHAGPSTLARPVQTVVCNVRQGHPQDATVVRGAEERKRGVSTPTVCIGRWRESTRSPSPDGWSDGDGELVFAGPPCVRDVPSRIALQASMEYLVGREEVEDR